MQLPSLSAKAAQWLRATAIHFGHEYRGRARVAEFLEACARGEYRIVKEEVANNKE